MFTSHAYFLRKPVKPISSVSLPAERLESSEIMSNVGRQLGVVKHSCPKNDTKQLPPVGPNDHGWQWLLELQKNSFNFYKGRGEELMGFSKGT